MTATAQARTICPPTRCGASCATAPPQGSTTSCSWAPPARPSPEPAWGYQGQGPFRDVEHLYGLPKDQLTPEAYEQARLG
eukprot:15446845-Alexandrium_andersonii.AAC.1